MKEKLDLASAYRQAHSTNIKTRRRALKIIKEAKQKQTLKQAKVLN
ncbi:putative metal homeostasis protein [Companilactobacillus ginsenosidimutans]|nr:putative metal homeostasis protein [Companilactobacillus ginsenosidimutans]